MARLFEKQLSHLFLVVYLIGACCSARAIDLENIRTEKVEVLLANQIRNEWSEDLLRAFPPAAEPGDRPRLLPATLFPALLKDNKQPVTGQFSEWCEQHLAAAKVCDGYGAVIDSLLETQDAADSQTLTSQLVDCASSEHMPPVLRLFALSAVVNSDHNLVVDSLVAFCLHYVNEIESITDSDLQVTYSDTDRAGMTKMLRMLVTDVLRVLVETERAGAIASYIGPAIDTSDRGTPVGVEDFKHVEFVPPFLLKRGDPLRVFRVSVGSAVLGDGMEEKTIVVSEQGVLDSYRRELLNHAHFVGLTAARHELHKFVEKLVLHAMSGNVHRASANGDRQAALDLLLARLLQIDDIGVIVLVAPLLQDDVNMLLGDEPFEENPRADLARALLEFLKSSSDDARLRLGVALRESYRPMLQLREAAASVERSLLADAMRSNRSIK